MSKAFVCDITGAIVNAGDVATKVAKQADITLNGVPVSLELIVKVDAFNGAQETHMDPDQWPAIMQKVKQWIISNYG